MEKSSLEDDVCERVIPSENIELMFHYRNSFKVKCFDNSTFKQSCSFISGISKSYADVSTSGETGLISVTFHPFGACHFFRFPLLEIEDRNINLDCIFRNEPKEIEEQLCEAQSLNERVAVIENFLRGKLTEGNERDRYLIKNGIALINQSKGQINTTSLSEKLLVTPKKLERIFSAFVGKTPKQFKKIVRFQNVITSFSSTENRSFTEIAYENGYFDQAHFIKDFKSFSGLTPKEYFINYQCQSEY